MSEEQSGENSGQRPPQVAGAITYSTRSNPEFVEPRPPRPARNLQDLLHISTQVSSRAGESSNQHLGPMDDESRRFLNEALASMTTNVVAELKAGVETIESLLKSDYFCEEDCDAAFDNILELVDKIDFANDYHKIGGFRVFNPCLASSSALMRWRCCELIAELCQNNPYCQEKCLKEGYLPVLVSLIDADCSDIVRIKALYAVSCLVRESEAALKEFTAKDGFSTILRALQSDNDKLKIKSSFLLSSLCAQCPQVKDDLVAMGFVEQMIGLIIVSKANYSIVEHLLSGLSSLIKDHLSAEAICRRPDLQLQSVLEFIIENAQGQEEAKEVIEYAKSIGQAVFEDNDNSVEEDR